MGQLNPKDVEYDTLRGVLELSNAVIFCIDVISKEAKEAMNLTW